MAELKSQEWQEEWFRYLNNNHAYNHKQNYMHEAISFGEMMRFAAEPLYFQNPDRWAEYYTTSLNNLASSHHKANHEEAARLFKKYFAIYDCIKDSDIRYFIYPLVKYYQCLKALKDTEELKSLEEFTKQETSYFKEKLSDEYEKIIQKEHEGYKNLSTSGVEVDVDKYEIFVKLFINNDIRG